MPLSIYGDNWAMDDIICVITKQPKPVIIKDKKNIRLGGIIIILSSTLAATYLPNWI